MLVDPEEGRKKSSKRSKRSLTKVAKAGAKKLKSGAKRMKAGMKASARKLKKGAKKLKEEARAAARALRLEQENRKANCITAIVLTITYIAYTFYNDPQSNKIIIKKHIIQNGG